MERDNQRFRLHCSCQFRTVFLCWCSSGYSTRNDGETQSWLANPRDTHTFFDPSQQFSISLLYPPYYTHTHSSPICVSSWRDLFWTQPTRLNTIDERTFCHSIILNLIGLHEMYRIYKEPAASAARQTGRRESLWYRGIDDVEGAKEIKRKEGTSEKLEREEERKKNSHNASFHRQVHSNLYPVAKGNCRCYILPSSYLCKSQVPASGPASSST